MSNKKDAVGLTAIAKILGVSRASAYIYARAGDIEGAEFVAGRLWVAPRGSVERFKVEREQRSAQPLVAA